MPKASRRRVSSLVRLTTRTRGSGVGRTTQWVGYKVYVTETCDDDQPRIITHVATSSAPIADGAITPEVHCTLEGKDLWPRTRIVDTGFLDAKLLDSSWRKYEVNLLGPTRPDYKWLQA